MSDQRYCTCARPNTRQTAFARANGYRCPKCDKTLNPGPNSAPYREDNRGQEDPPSPRPNFFPTSPLSEHANAPIPPDNYPNSLSVLRRERIFDTPNPPSNLLPTTGDEFIPYIDPDSVHNEDGPTIPIRSSSAPPAAGALEEGERSPFQEQQEPWWPSPPHNENPSPYQAGTPQRIIEVEPFDIVSDNDEQADDEASWDNFTENPDEHRSRGSSDASDHSYQSLLTEAVPQQATEEQNTSTTREAQPQEPHYAQPARRDVPNQTTNPHHKALTPKTR